MKRLALVPFLFVLACDKDERHLPPPASSAPAAPASALATLGLDAGMLGEVDPPAPAGDLKQDLERFVNLDACVAERARLDPLVGDALHGIGYDTFLRDACRMLEAAKDKKRETCDKLDSSALRAKCQSWVAMITPSADQCPMVLEGSPARGRQPSCVAIATRDPRLCASEPRVAARGTCEALTTREESKCDPLLAADRAACKRELARWKSVLAPPLAGLADLPKPTGKLVVRGTEGTADPPTPETDLGLEVSRGAVVVTARDRVRVELGAFEIDTARIAGSPNRRTRVGFAVVVDGKPSVDRFELEVPGEPPLSCATARCALEATGSTIDKTRGGAVAVKVTGTLTSGPRSYKVELEAKTFVRDVVTDVVGPGRLLPPVHPGLGSTPPGGLFGGARDAGR